MRLMGEQRRLLMLKAADRDIVLVTEIFSPESDLWLWQSDIVSRL